MTVAECSIRFTDAARTPSVRVRLRSTADWHAAQVIPFTGKVILRVGAVEAVVVCDTRSPPSGGLGDAIRE